MKSKTILLIFFLSLFFLLKFWIDNSERFSKEFNPQYFSELYSKSQYVLGQKSIGGIGDDGLYAFAGYYYFFQKGDVSAVNFEHPPLGKYLIGLSIFLFKNENFINIFYFILLLIFTYKLSRFYMDKILSLLPISILMIDPLFLDHTIRSQLDLPFTLFFVIGIYYFISSLKRPWHIFISQTFLGLAFSTRFFPFLLIIEVYMLILVFRQTKKNIIPFLISGVLIPLVYLICHISFFYYHPSIVEFMRHKKWMLSWFTGTPVKTGNILRNIFTGWLLDTTDKLVKNKEWSTVQPFVILFSLLPLKQNVLFGFVFIYFLYIVFLTGGQAKFLMPIYPLMAILAVKNLSSLYSIISQWMRLKFSPLKVK